MRRRWCVLPPTRSRCRHERVQRNAPLFVALAAGNLCAIHTSSNVDLDAFRTETHGSSDGHLDGAAVADAGLDLASNTFCNKPGINSGRLISKMLIWTSLPVSFFNLHATCPLQNPLSDDHRDVQI